MEHEGQELLSQLARIRSTYAASHTGPGPSSAAPYTAFTASPTHAPAVTAAAAVAAAAAAAAASATSSSTTTTTVSTPSTSATVQKLKDERRELELELLQAHKAISALQGKLRK